MRKCKFLNNAIYVDPNNLQQYVDEQFEKFKRDFIDNTTYIGNIPIKVDMETNHQKYGDILTNEKYIHSHFVHIVSRKIDKNKKERTLDIQRLRTCHWVKELIDYYNQLESNCQTCQHLLTKNIVNNKNENLLCIFCDCVRYIIILKKISTQTQTYYIFKTAFYLDQVYDATDYAYYKKLLT